MEEVQRRNKAAPVFCELIEYEARPLTILTSPAMLARGFLVAFTNREGGVSSAPYHSLNLAYHVGDDPANVTANRRTLAAALELDPMALTAAEQVHGDRIFVVEKGHKGRGAVSWDDSLPGIDALVTAAPEAVLAMFYADCVPLVLVDTEAAVVGIGHCGWRSTYLDITGGILEAMHGQLGAVPSAAMAFIGPSIRSCCFEVKDDVRRRFGEDWAGPWLRGSHLDLPGLVRHQLQKAGIAETNIYDCGICTCCDEELYYSFRRQATTGRQAALAAIL